MIVNYPNGKKASNLVEKEKKTPNMKKSRLGTTFESLINQSNEYYLLCEKALIYKKPTPVQVVKVDYPSRNKAKISEAYYKIPSTTDYNGLYRKKYLDFEAKSCLGKSFPFGHLFPHQIEHLHRVSTMGGIAFLLIEFVDYHQVFVLDATDLWSCYEKGLQGGRKSIPYDYFQVHGKLVTLNFNPPIDYLKIIDEIYF